MTSLKLLLARNRNWSQQHTRHDPRYFEQFLNGQEPHTLWIGCSDSRVPVEAIVQAAPGELFVHRNIANLVDAHDDNTMSTVQYALEHLHVTSIVICGHYGCGGIKYAAEQSITNNRMTKQNNAYPYIQRHLTTLTHTLRSHIQQHPHLQHLPPEEKNRALVEFNVRQQLQKLSRTSLIRNASRGDPGLLLYGCVYDLQTGYISLLHVLSPRTGVCQ